MYQIPSGYRIQIPLKGFFYSCLNILNIFYGQTDILGKHKIHNNAGYDFYLGISYIKRS